MPGVEEIVLAYVAAWNERDEAGRRELVEFCWSPTAVLVVPGAIYAGREDLLADIARFHRERPGQRGVLTSGIDGHHGWVRFLVAVQDAAGNTIAEGIDIGEIGPDGRLARIVTFWGRPPAPAP